MNEQEFRALAAGHALHALSAADEQRFALAKAENPQWLADADDDQETAAALAAMVEPVQPPPALRQALLAQISVLAQDPTGPGASGLESAVPTTDETAAEVGATGAAATEAADPADPAVSTPSGTGGPRRWSRVMFTLAACLVLLVGGGIATTIIVSQLQRPASVVALDDIRSAPDAEQATVRLDSGAT